MGAEASANQITIHQLILLATSVLGGGAALFAIWEEIRRRYRATIGRRAENYRQLARLGTGAQLSFFTSVLGEPLAMQSTIRKSSVPRYRRGVLSPRRLDVRTEAEPGHWSRQSGSRVYPCQGQCLTSDQLLWGLPSGISAML